MKCCLSTLPISDADAVRRAKSWQDMAGADYVKDVSCKEPFIWRADDAANHNATYFPVGTTMNDVHALLHSAPMITMVVPEMRTRNITMTRGGKSVSPWNFIGTWPNAVELNQHVVEHGRMFNEIDDENARNVCVIGTAIRDALYGAPEQIGREVIPIGDFININNQRFKIIGMFERYESEQDKKMRELAKDHPPEVRGGPERSKGFGSKSGSKGSMSGGFVYDMKNNTVYIPLNTMWLRFRAASVSSSSFVSGNYSRGSSGSSSGSGSGSRSGSDAGMAMATMVFHRTMPSIFTRIIQGEIPCHRLYEDEHVIAFLDIGRSRADTCSWCRRRSAPSCTNSPRRARRRSAARCARRCRSSGGYSRRRRSCAPASTQTSMASSATSVLPLPTSPCSRRIMRSG